MSIVEYLYQWPSEHILFSCLALFTATVAFAHFGLLRGNVES